VLLGAIGGREMVRAHGESAARARARWGSAGSSGSTRTCGPLKLQPALTEFVDTEAGSTRGRGSGVRRELTGGIYFGEKKPTPLVRATVCTYTVDGGREDHTGAARLAQQRPAQAHVDR